MDGKPVRPTGGGNASAIAHGALFVHSRTTMSRETAASKNAKAQAYLDARVKHFTDTPGHYDRMRTPIQVRTAVLDEYMNGGSWRLRDAGIEPQRYYDLARKLPSAYSWEELRASTPNGRRSVRNPQRYTVTAGGRRIRLAGGNTFASRTEADAAARYLRSEDGGDYRVRPLKATEARVAVANGRHYVVPVGGKCEACRLRRATRVLPGAGAPHVCDDCYRAMLREDEHARRSSSNGREATRTSCRNGGDVYYDVVDVSTEEGWRYIVMGKAKYNPLKNFAVVECRYGEPKCKLLRQFATRDKAHDYKYDLAAKLHDGQ